MATLIYLGGDAYPDEADCEKRLAWALATSNSFSFISQSSVLTDKDLMSGDWRLISHRLNQLEALVSEIDDEVILLAGRLAHVWQLCLPVIIKCRQSFVSGTHFKRPIKTQMKIALDIWLILKYLRSLFRVLGIITVAVRSLIGISFQSQ